MADHEDERPLSQTEPDDQRISSSSPRSLESSRAPSTEIEQRVRFSLDAPGEFFASSAGNRRSDANSRSSSPSAQRALGENAPFSNHESSPAPLPAVPGFSIPEQDQNRTDHEQPNSPTSPTSPTHRGSRGYSLRRQLFFRNAADRTEGTESTNNSAGNATGPNPPATGATGTVIELSSINASSKAETDISKRSGNENTGKSSVSASYSRGLKKGGQGGNRHSFSNFKSIYQNLRKIVLRIQEIPPTKDGRKISLNVCTNRSKTILTDERTGKHYINNSIRSSRYTIWTFFPRQLVAQFSKLANFYFLCISILQLIPNLSTTGRLTTFVPLCIFISISMAKEGFDDYRRYRQDRVENNTEARVLILGREKKKEVEESWKAVKWSTIRVGDIVKLKRDERVPADLLLLTTDGEKGTAYVETAALDGETNLKGKQQIPFVSEHFQDLSVIGRCDEEVTVEDPNADLYNFEGKIRIGETVKPLTNGQILYRGSVLRNTNMLWGLVIFTGEEAKIRMNANKRPRTKAPRLQGAINRVVFFMVFFILLLSLLLTILYIVWRNATERKSWYLENASVSLFPVFASYVIMFNTLIPLSLYVSLEIVKVCQMGFLAWDIDMYDGASNTPFEPRTSTINEELGQVSYIFSDKTGTLTDNVMLFRRLSVAGYAWTHNLDSDGPKGPHLWHKRRLKKKGKKAEAKRKSLNLENLVDGEHQGFSQNTPQAGTPQRQSSVLNRRSMNSKRVSAVFSQAQPALSTRDLIEYLQTHPHTFYARETRMFLMCMALCHTCLPEKSKDGDIKYQAASPDEIALVQAAKELGYIVVDRQGETVTIKMFPNGPDEPATEETYEILEIIEFSSKRKRMSIVLRFPNKKICILSKGADSTMVELLRLHDLAARKMIEVERFASERRSLEAQEFIRRSSTFHQNTNTQQKSRRSMASIGRRPSMSRPSVSGPSMSRPSMSHPSMNLPNMSGKGGSRIEDLDNWLKHRRGTFDQQEPTEGNLGRPSQQYNRFSIAIGETLGALERDTSEDIIDDKIAQNENMVFERCFQHVHEFATEGLRTLLYAYRYLEEDEFGAWQKLYSEATTSLVNRQEMIEQAAEEIEVDFELAGATGIEDKLQKGVPEAIDKLRRANIKMWMLTGDKRETAVNIGHSCRLVKDYSDVTVFDVADGRLEQDLTRTAARLKEGNVAHSVIVVDGATLAAIEEGAKLQALFFDLTVNCDSVICCRASPNQKAALVRSIRKKVKKSITLAVGDGANDIAMIQEAHVGIGITGKEGLAAARSSDYSVAQFRFLLKLLLVHGRWNYVRTCKYILGTFWKEMLFYLTQAMYQRWAGYAGTSIYEPWSLSQFNTLFTSLPVIFMGIFEKDLAASTLLAVPELYVYNQRSYFNIKSYIAWMFLAACHAAIIFYCMLTLYAGRIIFRENGIFGMGVLTFTAVVILVSFKMQIVEMHNKSITAVISVFLSLAGWFMWNGILDRTYNEDFQFNVRRAFGEHFGRDLTWWVVLLYVVSACVIFDLSIIAIRVTFLPTEVDDFQAIEKDVELRKRLEEEASSELQQGWLRGKKTSEEFPRDAQQAEIEAQREAEIEELLSRPRVMTADGSAPKVGNAATPIVHANTFPLESTEKTAPANRQSQNRNTSTVLGEGLTESPR